MFVYLLTEIPDFIMWYKDRIFKSLQTSYFQQVSEGQSKPQMGFALHPVKDLSLREYTWWGNWLAEWDSEWFSWRDTANQNEIQKWFVLSKNWSVLALSIYMINSGVPATTTLKDYLEVTVFAWKVGDSDLPFSAFQILLFQTYILRTKCLGFARSVYEFFRSNR